MKHYIWTFALLFSVIGCSGSSAPSVEQIKKDLVGQSIETGVTPRANWVVAAVDEVKELTIKQRFTDRKAGTDEVHISIALSDGKGTAKGDLVISYKEFEQGWRLGGITGKLPGSSYVNNGNGTVTDNYKDTYQINVDGFEIGAFDGKPGVAATETTMMDICE